MDPAAASKENAIEVVESKQSVYSKVEPLKAALYFENADGFGEWRVIISTDATKKLQELAGGDRQKCVVVVKKIKCVIWSVIAARAINCYDKTTLEGALLQRKSEKVEWRLWSAYFRGQDAARSSPCRGFSLAVQVICCSLLDSIKLTLFRTMTEA